MFVKDSDCEPGGGHRDYKCGPVFPPGACRQEFNGGVNVSTCRKGGGEVGGGSSGTGNTLPTFFMSNTSLCVTCHLRDTLTSSPLPASHTQTPFQKCKQAPVRTLTECLCCLPLGQKSCRTQPVPIWKLLVPRPV